MISRRRFFSICTMMLVILFMFQFSVLVGEGLNNYDTNRFLADTDLNSSDVWEADSDTVKNYMEDVIYIGDASHATGKIIDQWCSYSKRNLICYESLGTYEQPEENFPLFLCINGSQIHTKRDVETLVSLAEQGQNIVFCDLPDVKKMSRLPELQMILGIKKIVSEETELTGIRLFSGFLLGGEAIYQAESEDKDEIRDLEFNVPWYQVSSGTKMYMAGLTEDEEIDNEYLPGLIWRNAYGEAKIFAVNGSYMEGQTGLGLLSAMAYEIKEYEIYPVINAQNLSVVNFPGLASENTEEMMELYVRDQRGLYRDLIWPGMIVATNRCRDKMTCFLSPQLDYSSQEELSEKDLVYYLKQLNEQSAEAGLSMDYLPGTNLKDKLVKDQEFFDNVESQYEYRSAYVKEADIRTLLNAIPKGNLHNLRTITSVDETVEPIVSYVSDTITRQNITADGTLHTYSQDLKTKAIETALGYANIFFDMKQITWPANEDQRWETTFEAFSSNINTYWNAFSAFEKTTLTESDERMRSFLAMDYSAVRKDDMLTVNIQKPSDEVWFLLRTHNEIISDIRGGEYQKVEEDVYLIHAMKDSLKIYLEQPENRMYYLQ